MTTSTISGKGPRRKGPALPGKGTGSAGRGGRMARRLLAKLGVFAFWMLAWQLAYQLIHQEILLASPGRVLARLWELAGRPAFWRTVAFSFLRIMSGFGLALAAGILLAAATSASRVLDALARPLLRIVKATPVASFVILALVWLKSSRLAVFISFLMVLPIVWGNLVQGIKKTDPRLLEMGRLFRFGPVKTLVHIYLPSVFPYLIAAGTTGLGLAWKAGIAAEVLGTPKNSIGKYLYESKIYLEIPDLFAWTAVVILLSMALEELLLWLVRRRLPIALPSGEEG